MPLREKYHWRIPCPINFTTWWRDLSHMSISHYYLTLQIAIKTHNSDDLHLKLILQMRFLSISNQQDARDSNLGLGQRRIRTDQHHLIWLNAIKRNMKLVDFALTSTLMFRLLGLRSCCLCLSVPGYPASFHCENFNPCCSPKHLSFTFHISRMNFLYSGLIPHKSEKHNP